MSDSVAAQNTNIHLWPLSKEESCGVPSVFATSGGGIGMNVKSHCITMSIEEWHALAVNKFSHIGPISPQHLLEQMPSRPSANPVEGKALLAMLRKGAEDHLYSDEMDSAFGAWHGVMHGIQRNADRAGEQLSGETGARRALAYAIDNYVESLKVTDVLERLLAAPTSDEATKRDAWRPMETAPVGIEFVAVIAVRDRRKGGKATWEHHILRRDDEDGQVCNGYEQGWDLEDYQGWAPLIIPSAIDAALKPSQKGSGEGV